jgi:hypothetical protein
MHGATMKKILLFSVHRARWLYPFVLSNHLVDIHKNWYELYAIGIHSNIITPFVFYSQ